MSSLLLLFASAHQLFVTFPERILMHIFAADKMITSVPFGIPIIHENSDFFSPCYLEIQGASVLTFLDLLMLCTEICGAEGAEERSTLHRSSHG